LLVSIPASQAFQTSSRKSLDSSPPFVASKSPLFSAATGSGEVATKELSRRQLVRQQGGIFAFTTKYGALNPFAIYYGLVAIGLGIPWYISLKLYAFFQILTRGRFDKHRRVPTFLNHVWGVTLMRLTRSFPKVENMDTLRDFYKENRPAMFVANHASFMDIPFMGSTIGWRNYKFVAKKELEKVPILSSGIKVALNLMVDRTDKRSGLKTLRTGIDYMKDGIHLCTFPEGTRSVTGRVKDFKNGAFKMAHKAGVPVIPLSIVGAHKVQPTNWMFPCAPAHSRCKVVINKPIESKSLSEAELAEKVKQAMIDALPDDQKPLQKK